MTETKATGEMRFVNLDGYGGPEVLRESNCEIPAVSDGEVLIKVAAAGVNRPDVIQRMGFYEPPPGASAIPGLEVAGEVVEVAAGVERWKPGDRVCALISGGGYAEYVNAPARQCLPVPDSLDMVEAACLPETAFTVWSNVFDRGGLADGETLLVHGGSSGIGTIAIQLAAARGHRVFATAGSAAKCDACTSLGAELAVNYRSEDFVELISEATNGAGVDVILDMVGGDYVERNIKLAAVEGRIVSIAFLQGSNVSVNLMPMMLKRLVMTGSTLRARDAQFKAKLAQSVEQNVWPLIEADKLRPVIHQRFALADASAAHEMMESSEHIGKLVLDLSLG